MSSDKNPKYTRRQIIKNVVIGGVLTTIVLPRKWTRPIIDTVVTPAHAAASAPATTAGPTSTTEPTATPEPTVTPEPSFTPEPTFIPGPTAISDN